MPQIVGAAGNGGGSRPGPEGLTAGSVPGAAVAAFAERAAAGAAEQAAIGCAAVAAAVVAEHGDQNRRDGDGPDRSFGPVLKAALLVAGSGAGPRLGGAGHSPGQGQHPPAAGGQVAVLQAQGDGLFRAPRAVIETAEECGQVGPDPGYGGEQGLGLHAAGHDVRVYGGGGLRGLPADLVGGLESSSPVPAERRPSGSHLMCSGMPPIQIGRPSCVTRSSARWRPGNVPVTLAENYCGY